MGLAERRAVETFKKGKWNDHVKDVLKIVGSDVKIEADWDSFQPSLEQYNDKEKTITEFVEDVFIKPLKLALEAICQDDMGKDAIKGSLKKIRLVSTGEYNEARGVFFEKGELKLDQRYNNVHYINDRAKAIQKKLEENL